MDISSVAAAAIVVLLLAGLALRGRGRAKTRALEAARWGSGDTPHRLDADDLSDIGAYCRARSEAEPCDVDDITWNDLDMDEVFAALDRAKSSVGEEILYDMLHRCGESEETLLRRARIMEAMERCPQARVKTRQAIARLGRGRYHGAHGWLFAPASRRAAHAGVYLALGLSPIVCLLLALIDLRLLLLLIPVFASNIAVYYVTQKRYMHEIAAVRHIAAVLETGKRLTSALPPELGDIAEELRALTGALRPVGRWSALFAMQRVSDFDFLTDYVRIFFQLDMICLGRLGACFERENEALRSLYARVGELDACIAVASFRAGAGRVCAPEFGEQMRVSARGVVHPLLKKAVSNDMDWTGCALLTGSNASGKSTFVKAMAVNAILAQTILTCTADGFSMPRLRVMTSMALRDNVRGGESYFVVEVRSLKRMLRAAESGEKVMLMIDEILRGTNTTERIAASRALLEALACPNALCMAATHDIELTRLLRDYRQLHFEESLEGGEMTFDFKLYDGPSLTRNAIALMRQMGFPEAITGRAESAAKEFERSGSWA